MLGKIESRVRKGTTQDKHSWMASSHSLEQAPEIVKGQGSSSPAVHGMQRVGHD